MSLLTITVEAWECLLARKPGEPTRVLGAGRHRRALRTRYERVDLREQMLAIGAQEITTADGLGLKVSASITWRIADPIAHTERSADPLAQLYLAAQVALREVVITADADAVLAGRADWSDRLTGPVVAAGLPLGIEVLAATVKDVVLPVEVRAAYAAVITERQRATVKLEAARAETAALRSLANAAKLLDDHPALARLRTVQELPYGSTVKLIAGGGPVD